MKPAIAIIVFLEGFTGVWTLSLHAFFYSFPVKIIGLSLSEEQAVLRSFPVDNRWLYSDIAI